MGWEDRQYGSDHRRSVGSVLWNALSGSFPIGRFRGIRIRVHASLPILAGMVILLDYAKGFDLQTRIISMVMLFVIVLLHEFGHCFAARAVGGSADDILMWPLGGLASTDPPRRPLPTFITVAAGPAVNLAICLVCGITMWLLHGWDAHLLNPFNINATFYSGQVGFYVFWVYLISYELFLFNALLPIYPLDGGQMLQSILWPHIGYHRSMIVSCVVGMVAAGIVGLYALVGWHLFLLVIMASCLWYCYQRLMMLREMGPEEWAAEYDGVDYSASLKLRPDDEPSPKRKRRVNRWKARRLRRIAMLEDLEQQRIDAILAKVSAHGMQSLTWGERRALKRATERQRRRELEVLK
jgi:Zn-dependent protease